MVGFSILDSFNLHSESKTGLLQAENGLLDLSEEEKGR